MNTLKVLPKISDSESQHHYHAILSCFYDALKINEIKLGTSFAFNVAVQQSITKTWLFEIRNKNNFRIEDGCSFHPLNMFHQVAPELWGTGIHAYHFSVMDKALPEEYKKTLLHLKDAAKLLGVCTITSMPHESFRYYLQVL